jgi:hypothetical protein
MKIKSLRLALCEGGNPEYPTGAGSSVNLWCGLDRRQGVTTSAGDAPQVSATRERRARGIKIFGDNGSDTLYGNGGNDVLRGDNNPVGGGDGGDGGDGTDTCTTLEGSPAAPTSGTPLSCP